METERIRKMAELMKTMGVEEMTFADKGWRVRMVKTLGVPAPGPGTSFAASPTSAPAVTPPAGEFPASDTGETVTVRAGRVGSFASVKKDGHSWPVSGSAVKKGETIGQIRALDHVYNIPSDVDGTVAVLHVFEGQILGFGKPIFTLRPGA